MKSKSTNNIPAIQCLRSVTGKLLLMTLVLFASFGGAKADELTVCDGRVTNQYVPAYVYFFDDFTKAQTVFPADVFEEMSGATITGIKFYTTSSNIPYETASEVNVYLTEVEYTSISSFEETSSLTTVYNGTLSFVLEGNGGAVSIAFDTPYVYGDKNLLIGIENTTDEEYKQIFFYGQSVTGASVYSYNSSSLSNITTATQCNFLPKTTFTYTPDANYVPKPTGLAATLTQSDATIATLSWTEKGTATEWVLEYGTAPDFTGATSVNVSGTPSHSLTGLTPEANYYARVKAITDSNNESKWSVVCSFWPTATIAVVVNDETHTTPCYPISGGDIDNGIPYKSQFIIAADILEDINPGSTIKRMTFYSSPDYPDVSWGNAAFNVYMKEVTETGFADATFVEDGLTTVYQGTLNVASNKMEVILNQDFTYNGGNLLIGFEQTAAGSSNYVDWLCAESSENTGVYTYMTSNDQTVNTLSYMPKITFHVLQAELTCDKPKNLAAANITHEQATITWTSDESAWNIAWSTDPDFDPESQTTTSASNVSEKTYTITGLSPLTTYYVSVQSACGGNWSKKLPFKTLAFADPVGDDWSDDFEGSTCGWELINGTCTNAWVWGETIKNGGTHALYISNDGGTTNAYSIDKSTIVYAAKFLAFTAGKYVFAYDWLANGESSFDFIRVALVPATVELTAGTSTPWGFSDKALPAGWIALDGGSKLNLATEWQSKTVAINVAAGNYYLVFAWRNDGSGGTNPPAAIDNVSISRMACVYDVEGLAVSNVTTTSAALTWTAGEASQWQVAYSTNASFEGATETIVSDANYSMAGLQIGTYYYVKVRAYCGGNDYGTWSEVLKFNTELEPITTYPWTENFDSYTASTSGSANNLPLGWHYINTTTNSYCSGYPIVYGGQSHSGSNSLLFHSYAYYSNGSTSYDPQDQYVIFPPMENLTGKQITLYAASNSTNPSTFIIGRMTDPRDASTFVPIATQTLTGSYFEEYNYTLTGTGNYIAIMVEAANPTRTSNTVFIDDITIVAFPKPTSLTVANVTAHNATLSWSENGSASVWQICINDDEENLIEVTNPSFVLDVDPEKTYQVKVRAKNGSEYSDWSQDVTFTTPILCPVPAGLAATDITSHTATISWTGYAASYKGKYRSAAYVTSPVLSEDFNANMPNSWTGYTGLVDEVIAGTATLASGNSSWRRNNYALGSYHAVLNIYGTSCKSWLVTPEVTLANGFFLNFDLALTDYYNSNGLDYPDGQADDRFVVLITTNNGVSWTILREWNNSGSADVYNDIATAGESVIIDLSGYAGKTVKVAFYGESTSGARGTEDNDLHIDNVAIGIGVAASEWQTFNVTETTTQLTGLLEETPYEVNVRGVYGDDGESEEAFITFITDVICPVPTGLAVSGVGTDVATLNWESNADSWQICVNDDEEHPIDNVTVKSYTLTGLTPGTGYTVKVRGYITNDGYSKWTTNVNFTTVPVDAVPFDLAANQITSATAKLNCTGYQDSYNVQYRTAGRNNNQDFENGMGDWSVVYTANTPGINMSEAHTGDNCFRFSSYNSASSYDQYLISPQLASESALSFWYKNSNSDAEVFKVGYSSTDTDIASFTWGDEVTVNTSTWLEYSEAIPTGAKYVAIHYYSNYKYYLYIDDFTFTGDIIPAGEWQIANNVTTPHSLTGLTAGTKYEWQVQGNYSGGVTDWSPLSTFTTLDLLELAVDNTANSTIISSYDGKNVGVQLQGRKLWKDDKWNTLFLPFGLSEEQVNEMLENPSALMALDVTSTESDGSTKKTRLDGTTLYLQFEDATTISPRVPYIIKWSASDPNYIENPVFSSVTIDATTSLAPRFTFEGGEFKGIFDQLTVTGEDKSILFLGTDDNLYYPNGEATTTIQPFTAYFQMDNSSSAPVQRTVLNFGEGTTAIEIVNTDPSRDGREALPLTGERGEGLFYDLSGRHINGIPTEKGIYIVNGKKVIVK